VRTCSTSTSEGQSWCPCSLMDIDYHAVTVEICSISAVTPPLHLRGITASFTCITAGFPRLPRYYRHPHYRAGLYRLVGHVHSLAHVTNLLRTNWLQTQRTRSNCSSVCEWQLGRCKRSNWIVQLELESSPVRVM